MEEKKQLESAKGTEVVETLLSNENKDEESTQSLSAENAVECAKVAVQTTNVMEQANPNLRYEGSKCIYTDPTTTNQFEWNEEKQEWVLKITGEPRSKDVDAKSDIPNNHYEFDGESYCYTDSQTGVSYKYNNSTKKWEVKENAKKTDRPEVSKVAIAAAESEKKQDMESGIFGYENDTHTYTDPSDGSVYIWDKEKGAWFPKVDEEFLAHYQMSYGFTPSGEAAPTVATLPDKDTNSPQENKQAEKRKGPPPEPTWFELDEQHNTKVYVTNLPLDITEQEFVDLMQKCGLVMRDADSGRMKVKLYTEPNTKQLKGDALCTYIKIESVDLALKLLDGYDYKGHRLHVERAKFQMKGSAYDPTLKPKKRKRKEKDRLKKMQEKLFDWRPEKMRGERSKHERVVIVKNLFDPSLFDKDVSLLLEYQQDLREECSKCGDVRRVLIYDRHPEGVAQITFREPEEADACVLLLNGRWFCQRKLSAEIWDGKTKYKIGETYSEIQQRLSKWDEFLESDEVQKKMANKSESVSADTQSAKVDSILAVDKSNSSANETPTENVTSITENRYVSQ